MFTAKCKKTELACPLAKNSRASLINSTGVSAMSASFSNYDISSTMYIKMYVADVLLLAPPTNKLIHSGRTVNKVGKVTKLGEWICYSSNGRRGREQSFWRNILLR